MEQLGQDPSSPKSAPTAWAVPESYVHKFCQEKASLPGVGTEVYRPTGGTSSSQRQQEHLTPQNARWQKANARILPTENKIIWQHHNLVPQPQQVLKSPPHQKSKM